MGKSLRAALIIVFILVLAFASRSRLHSVLADPVSETAIAQANLSEKSQIASAGSTEAAGFPAPERSTAEANPVASAKELALMKKILDRGDACDLVQSTDFNALGPGAVASLLDGFESDPVLVTAKDLVVDPLLLGKSRDEVQSFFYALYVGGLVSGSAPESSNLQRSLELLNGIAKRESDNGAIPYFRAALRSGLHQPDREIRSDLDLAMTLPRFDSHMLSVAREVYIWGLTDPARYLVSLSLRVRLPIPYYTPSQNLLIGYLDQADASYAERLLAFGKKLMDKNERGSAEREFVGWSALEFQIGRLFARKAWERLHPGVALPEAYSKTFREFFREEKYFAPWTDVAKDRCDRDQLREAVEAEKREFFERNEGAEAQ